MTALVDSHDAIAALDETSGDGSPVVGVGGDAVDHHDRRPVAGSPHVDLGAVVGGDHDRVAGRESWHLAIERIGIAAPAPGGDDVGHAQQPDTDAGGGEGALRDAHVVACLPRLVAAADRLPMLTDAA